ncbi:phage holin family protein [Bacillus sp. FJAT-45350]|uniref:phage holin family protein n=1 Tax=Bacillus sp. FJAT-45350 TaxID=2011014 RepID=UPI000BB93FA1|nr:phage holin family protein [Bacillus sp. FJAT-45350]
MENISKFIIAISSSILTFLFGAWSVLLQVLIVFIIIDYVTGLIAAVYSGKLSSKVGFKGIIKKVMILSIVTVAHGLDIILGGFNFLRDVVIYFYILNELLSIIENAGRIGLPLPNVIKKAVEVLKKKDD